MRTTEPTSFILRPATTDDVSAIYTLLQSQERALYGYSDKILAFVQTTYSSQCSIWQGILAWPLIKPDG